MPNTSKMYSVRMPGEAAWKFGQGGHEPYTINVDIDHLGEVIKHLEKFGNSLGQACDAYCEEMADRGVDYARQQIDQLAPNNRGGLKASIIGERVKADSHSAEWTIHPTGEYAETAQYFEFGTGRVARGLNGTADNNKINNQTGIASFHPSGKGRYKENGWYYYDKYLNKVVHTYGQPAHPFMYRTGQYLKSIKKQVAEEMFS